jgi:hypothetical protein
MRPLRRVPVELFAGQLGKSRTHEHRLPRRHRRLALGGKLRLCQNRRMMTKPAYLMTLEEIDRCYPIECAERHQAFRAREHSFAMYDFHGKPIPHPNSKEDLLKIISERDLYVVDSNSVWKKE